MDTEIFLLIFVQFV